MKVELGCNMKAFQMANTKTIYDREAVSENAGIIARSYLYASWPSGTGCKADYWGQIT